MRSARGSCVDPSGFSGWFVILDRTAIRFICRSNGCSLAKQGCRLGLFIGVCRLRGVPGADRASRRATDPHDRSLSVIQTSYETFSFSWWMVPTRSTLATIIQISTRSHNVHKKAKLVLLCRMHTIQFRSFLLRSIKRSYLQSPSFLRCLSSGRSVEG